MKRRQALKAGAGIGILALAGCSGIGGGGGGTESFGNIAEWAPAPGEFDSDLESYGVAASSPAGIASQINDQVFQVSAAPSLRFASPKATDVDFSLAGEGSGPPEDGQYGINFTVHVGDFNPDWIDQNLQNTQSDDGGTSPSEEFQSEGQYQEFTLYANENPDGFNQSQTAYGFNDSGYIRAEVSEQGDNADPDAVAAVETLIDASEDTASRYFDSDQDMSVLNDSLPSGHGFKTNFIEEPPDETDPAQGNFEDLVAEGEVQTVSGNETDITEVLVFRSESGVSERDINEYVDESGEFSGYASRPAVTIDGRTAVIEGTQPTTRLPTLQNIQEF
jgi:hypothetical protein